MHKDNLLLSVSSFWPSSETLSVNHPYHFAEKAQYGGVVEMPRARVLYALRHGWQTPDTLQMTQRAWNEDRHAERAVGMRKSKLRRSADYLASFPWLLRVDQVDEIQRGIERQRPDIHTAINWNIRQNDVAIAHRAAELDLEPAVVRASMNFTGRVRRPVLKYFKELRQSPAELVHWAQGSFKKLGHTIFGKGEGELVQYAGDAASRKEALSSLLGVTEAVFIPLGFRSLHEIVGGRSGLLAQRLHEIETTRLPDGSTYNRRYVVEVSPVQAVAIAQEKGSLNLHRKISDYILNYRAHLR